MKRLSKLLLSEKFLKWSAILLIFICAIAIYGASLGNGYIWDDDYYVYKNGLIQRPDGLQGIWFSHQLPQYYPVVFTSFWIEYQFWGLNPFGYHAVNLFLHLCNALLIFFILRRLNPKLAFPVALLFTVHPIQVETVAWITERKNLLGLFFFLLTFISYISYEKEKKFRHYLLVLLFFALALLSKSVTVCFAVLPIIYIWWKDAKLKFHDVLKTIPLFIIGLSAALHTAYLEVHRAGAHGDAWNFTFIQKILLASRILFFYIQKILVPFDFMFFYPRWQINSFELWQWLYPLLTIFFLAFLYKARQIIGRGGFCLFLFYIASIFPALGFFNVFPMQYSYVADHFSYLSSPVIFLFVVSSIFYAINDASFLIKNSWKIFLKWAGWGFFGSIVFFLSVESWFLTQNYKNSFSLWSRLLQTNPASAAAYINLGSFYLNAEKPKQAIPLLKKAIEIAPEDFIAYNNLASAYKMLGLTKEALAYFHRAVAIKPDFFFGYYNLALLYHQMGQDDFAMLALEKTIGANKKFAPAYLAIGNIYFIRKEYQRAITYYQETLKYDPGNFTAYSNLAVIFKETGQMQLAEEMARRAQFLSKENEKMEQEMKNIAI